MKIYERNFRGRFARFMSKHDWGGACLVLPFVCVVLYWDYDEVPLKLQRHELTHAVQASRYGFFGWWARYLWGLRKGYKNNPLEVEARNAE